MMMRISPTFPGECLKFIYSTAYRTRAKRENEAICGRVYGVCEVTMARASLRAVLHRHTHVILGRHNSMEQRHLTTCHQTRETDHNPH